MTEEQIQWLKENISLEVTPSSLNGVASGYYYFTISLKVQDEIVSDVILDIEVNYNGRN